jgi:hypothetical protein
MRQAGVRKAFLQGRRFFEVGFAECFDEANTM